MKLKFWRPKISKIEINWFSMLQKKTLNFNTQKPILIKFYCWVVHYFFTRGCFLSSSSKLSDNKRVICLEFSSWKNDYYQWLLIAIEMNKLLKLTINLQLTFYAWHSLAREFGKMAANHVNNFSHEKNCTKPPLFTFLLIIHWIKNW